VGPKIEDLVNPQDPATTSPGDYAFLIALRRAESARKEVRSLAEHVVRQGVFLDQMHEQLWIRSPVLEDTLRRAVDRYDKFSRLFKEEVRATLVPTMDIDLVWHTHQLFHMRYRASMGFIAGFFIDHNDRRVRAMPPTWKTVTRKLFERTYEDEEYARCLCWDCEAMLSAAEREDGITTTSED
jgi:hypothetical protein